MENAAAFTSKETRCKPPHRAWYVITAALTLAVLVFSAIYLGTSGAGLSAKSNNTGNSVKSGDLILTDNDNNVSLFLTEDDALLTQGQQLNSRCIKVTYTGSGSGKVVTDDFSSFNGSLWFVTPDYSKVQFDGNNLMMQSTNPTNSLQQHTRINMNNHSFGIKVTQGVSANEFLWINLWVDSSNRVALRQTGTRLYFEMKLKGVTTTTNTDWDLATMPYFRIKRQGQIIRWEYSADGKIWSLGREEQSTINLSSVIPAIETGYSGTLANPSTAKIDSFSYLPNSEVRWYATTSGSLAPYLNVTVEKGTGTSATGGTARSCDGFTPEKTDFTGKLNDIPTDYAHALGLWSPPVSPTTVAYRFSVQVDPNAPQETQGGTASATFQWEARLD